EEDSSISTFTIDKGKKNIGGHSYSPVWKYFTRREKVAKEKYKATCNLKDESNKKRKSNTQEKLDQYISIIELDQQKIKKIHLAWAKTFAISYLLEQQLAIIIKKLIKYFNKFKFNLRWLTNKKNYSIWNFIIITLEHKEYLYKLCDFSNEIYTGQFLADKINKVLDSVNIDHFLAIVSNNRANVKLARSIISSQHPHIFRAELRSLIETMNIVGEGLKNYSKTRWTTASDSIESILHLEKVLKK
ncbi:3643_t:CDS:2, partial [Cetraspora pellucida]